MQTSRTFYPGAQRYATSLWSGDIGIQFYKGQKPDLTWATGMQEQRSRMLSAINWVFVNATKIVYITKIRVRYLNRLNILFLLSIITNPLLLLIYKKICMIVTWPN